MRHNVTRRSIPSARRFGLLLALLLAGGCATTKIVESWTAPGLKAEDLHFKHVLAIAVMPDATRQRIVEDALAAAATRTEVTPAYTLLSPEDRTNVDRVREVLLKNGIDGVVTVTLVDAKQQQTYVPGSPQVYPGGFYGYYGRMGGVAYDPGYIRTDTIVMVETSLYDVAQSKLLWSGVSKTLNPQNVDSLIKEIVEAARDELRKKGLLS